MNSQQLITKSKKFKKATWITSIFGIILLAFSIWALDYLDSETIDVFFHSGAYILIIPRVLLSGLKIYTNRKIGEELKNGATELKKVSVVLSYINIIVCLFILFIVTCLSFTEIDL